MCEQLNMFKISTLLEKKEKKQVAAFFGFSLDKKKSKSSMLQCRMSCLKLKNFFMKKIRKKGKKNYRVKSIPTSLLSIPFQPIQTFRNWPEVEWSAPLKVSGPNTTLFWSIPAVSVPVLVPIPAQVHTSIHM